LGKGLRGARKNNQNWVQGFIDTFDSKETVKKKVNKDAVCTDHEEAAEDEAL
jgi:hypothetical protein